MDSKLSSRGTGRLAVFLLSYANQLLAVALTSKAMHVIDINPLI